jgi:hypothetical protein
MNQIARALLRAAAFIELAGDDVIDSHFAVRALEDIASELATSTAEEREVLRAAAYQMAEEARQAGPPFESEAKFFSSFLYAVGLDEDPSSLT